MKRRISRSLRTPVLALLATALVWSCSEQPVDPTSSLEGPISPTLIQRDLAMVMEVQERHTPQLMRVPNVVGTAVSLGTDGQPVVTVLARNTSRTDVPTQLEGVPVEVMVTGEFHALPPIVPFAPKCGTPPCGGGGGGGGGGGDVDPTARFDRPVPIGVSTGHPDITAGTIGARVTDGTNVYALSNNHVYADVNAASIGDLVIQPGTFDGGSLPADEIGTLSAYVPIVFNGCSNTVDAAIASTTTGLLGNSTPSGGYGTPKSATVSPEEGLGKKVKKYGRTTGQTSGSIGAINATVNVNYGVGIACFTDQIIITPGSFSSGGDSGSLIVMDGKGRDKSLNKRPVGLLYAGSSFQTIANPIDPVLDGFGVTIDGD